MTKGDKCLIISIIIISLFSLWYVKKEATSYGEKYILIQVDGKDYKKITFGPEVIGKKIPIKTEFGYNLIEIGDGKVRVIEADCPDQLDVKQGYIDSPGEVIVCLPNKLVVEIKGKTKDEDIDYISH
ncbi:MAG: NusG domain II-containing protein [Clostridiaceae bacterium]|nr:NusG domain II-containing protein [Clostridiaceae bacterium]MBW4859585.1 NusG domain II-containing protein [Clostridiaceae bacterium]MBW4868554.1 NusG domain II-containing protein [Clostridiaceae bacterium]